MTSTIIHNQEQDENKNPNNNINDLYKSLGAICVFTDLYSNNWIAIEHDPSLQKNFPLTILSPFYYLINRPQTQSVYNANSFVLAHYTKESGEVRKVVPKEKIEDELKKLFMLNVLIEPITEHHDFTPFNTKI